MPLAWTTRVLSAVIRHTINKRKPLPSRALFHPVISQTYTSLLETDYNLHKSNSTYFSDLDVSRGHCVMHLFQPGIEAVNDNAKTRLVLGKDDRVPEGRISIILGSVFCSFKKEIAPYQAYEMWTRVLAWDRKWLYMLTYFVVKGKVRPTAWDSMQCRDTRQKGEHTDFEQYIIATAVSKYVFKLGRLTVNPSIIIEASGLLPERPGEGWRGGPQGTGAPDELDGINADSDWDWKRVEWERRKGMVFAEQFAALDAGSTMFDGGEDGALGRFSIG
ncbi:Protein THEM6 [Pleurostoma richardsiae]|uniref:Protein THEM6 n=1 Tax=Pleurostoma richardsiae TaxID=41990 RepID=A0AA38VMH2_9PEZI|nr:Protein THEM6 [Pleurostoma richardsiae]